MIFGCIGYVKAIVLNGPGRLYASMIKACFLRSAYQVKQLASSFDFRMLLFYSPFTTSARDWES